MLFVISACIDGYQKKRAPEPGDKDEGYTQDLIAL